MTMSPEVLQAIKEICKELSQMPSEEFERLLKEHEDGDISQLLMKIWGNEDKERK